MKTVRVRMYRHNPSKTRHRKHRRWGAVAAHKRRVNPSHKKRRHVRRRNPAASVRQAFNKNTLIRAAGLGVGFVAGNLVIQGVTTGTVFGRVLFTPPAVLSGGARPVVGLFSIVIGTMVGAKAKKQFAKDIALGITAAGGYDIVKSLVNMAAPGTLGMYINEGMPTGRVPLGLGVNAGRGGSRMGRIGPTYRIPTRDLSLGGYAGASFSDVDSSFPAG